MPAPDRRIVITIDAAGPPQALRWLREFLQAAEHDCRLVSPPPTPCVQPLHDSTGTIGNLCVTPIKDLG